PTRGAKADVFSPAPVVPPLLPNPRGKNPPARPPQAPHASEGRAAPPVWPRAGGAQTIPNPPSYELPRALRHPPLDRARPRAHSRRGKGAIRMLRTQCLANLLAGALLCAAVGSGEAANCQTQPFERWLDGVRQEAAAQGVSPGALAALNGLGFDPAVVRRDHGQGVFQQSFLQFSDRMAAGYRIQGGMAMIKRHADLFARIEKQYGVPAPVITAFWALESDFGSNNGKYPILRAVATLAYDCRRPQFFRTQLIDALRIIQRGDLRATEMIGDWAGELGPLQFTPSDYYKYAVDYDGDGRRDLIHSVPDLLASGANFLVGLGWKGGEPWLQEVRAGTDVPWDQATLATKHPRCQ